jgi:5-methylthioribose kinase
MTPVYGLREIKPDRVETLVSILTMIHRTKAPKNFPDNIRMRRLNHQHIFVLPFEAQNGFILDDVQIGLKQLSLPYTSDPVLKTVVGSVGERYLSRGEILLHGDYYPGSWMTAGDRIYVIDPEFGFLGFKEFDLGVMAAHLIMATAEKAHLETLARLYGGNIDERLLAQVAGIEIMRRLLGLAQLPLERTLEEKDYLLRTAYKLILP